MAKNILLLNDTEDVYHWGCYGTSKAIKDELKKKGIINIESITVYSIHELHNVPERVADFGNRTHFCSTYPALAEQLDKCDAVVINGEGTIHGFRNGARALLFLAYSAKHYFGKMTVLINHSCYPKSSRKKVLDFYKAGYSSCDYIAARESRSAKNIKEKLGINCVQSFDSLPLSIKKVYDEITPPLITTPYICLSGAVNYKLSRSPIIARQLLKKFPNHTYIYLVGSKEEGINHEEPRVYNSLKESLPNLQLFDAKSFNDWLSIIKHGELLLSGRFHYTIAALCLGTRAIYLGSNTPKISSIAEDLNLPRAIPRRPAFLFEYMLWRQLRKIDQIQWPIQLDSLCQMAQKNYDWDLV